MFYRTVDIEDKSFASVTLTVTVGVACLGCCQPTGMNTATHKIDGRLNGYLETFCFQWGRLFVVRIQFKFHHLQ